MALLAQYRDQALLFTMVLLLLNCIGLRQRAKIP